MPPTASSPSTAAAALIRPGRRRRWASPLTRLDLLVLAGIGVLAFAVRLQMAVRGGGLLGIGAYDDGVHYAAAASLVHGRLPYRDFLFLQPPGMALAATPFAALGRLVGDPDALRAFRIAFQLIGALNAVLVAVVLRRWGRPAAIVGGVFYAVFFQAVYDERTALLEPIGTLGVLAALLLTARGRGTSGIGHLLAGVALGVACGFKIWYVVPALVVLAFAHGGRVRVLIGAVAAGLAVYLPFFVAAPQRMFEQVVLAQLGRARSLEYEDVLSRAQVLVGVDGIQQNTPIAGVDPTALTVVLLVLLAVAVAAAIATPGARVLVALLVADSAIVLSSPSFFAHYAALLAPVLALLLGVAVARLLPLLPRRPQRAVAVAAVLVAVVGLNVRHDLDRVDIRPPGKALQAAAARIPGCIVSDDPTMLAVMDVLSRDLDRGCPLRPDVGGYSFGPERVLEDGRIVSRKRNTGYQRSVVDYLLSGSAFIRVRENTALNAASVAVLRAQPVLFRAAEGYALRAGDGGR